MLKVGINPSFPLSSRFLACHLRNAFSHFLSSFQHLLSLSSLSPPSSPPWPHLSPPGWHRGPADDWQLRVLWLLMNPVKQSCAGLCDRNEGQKERQQGFKLFSYSVSCHTHIFYFFSPPPPQLELCFVIPTTLSPERQRDWSRYYICMYLILCCVSRSLLK